MEADVALPKSTHGFELMTLAFDSGETHRHQGNLNFRLPHERDVTLRMKSLRNAAAKVFFIGSFVVHIY